MNEVSVNDPGSLRMDFYGYIFEGLLIFRLLMLEMNTTRFRQSNTCLRKTKFLSLMDLYEQNYIHLRNLIPEMQFLNGRLVSYVPGCIDLHLTVLEQCKYTTIINLTYQFEASNPGTGLSLYHDQNEPSLEVRIYHDAQVAECREGTFHDLVQSNTSVSENKWYLNRFLHKWLSYSLQKGHCFVDRKMDERHEHSIAHYLLTGYSNNPPRGPKQ